MKPQLGWPLAAGLAAACVAPPNRVALPPAPPPPPLGQPVRPSPPIPVAADAFRLSEPPQQDALLKGQVPEGTALLLLDGRPVKFDTDGRFIIGFGRDGPSTARLEARLADGRLLSALLSVAKRPWDISYLPTISRGTGPSTSYNRVRAAETAQIQAARAIPVVSDGWKQSFRWPTTGRISTLFGSQRVYAGGVAGAYHGGIDIARPTGTPVYAPADGVVILASDHPFSLEGNLLMIGHGMGLDSQLMHLSRIDVVQGQTVHKGDQLGLVGMTGRATGPHLHWGLMWNGQRIDPLLVAGPVPGQPEPVRGTLPPGVVVRPVETPAEAGSASGTQP